MKNKASSLMLELLPAPQLSQIGERFCDWPGLLVFESARHDSQLGRWSFLTADPFETFVLPQAKFGLDPFEKIRPRWRQFAQLTPTVSTDSASPPFQGGAAGLLSYELGRCWERLPTVAAEQQDPLSAIPDLIVGFYDWVIAWDHQTNRCWLISQGFPETDPTRRRKRAAERSDMIQEKLRTPRTVSHPPHSIAAPSVPTSNFSAAAYRATVARVQEYIRAGDIFQANLAQRFSCPARSDAWALYRRLCTVNPAPFAGFYRGERFAIASASPERFLQVVGRDVITRPIKGTRRRQAAEADLFAKEELRDSRKDRAENVMIVDLLRNDLSRVCCPGTVRTPQLCQVETFETVQHLVSEVRGELAATEDFWTLLAATFPGGSITGAPKVRAMEIISELECALRGPYCGSLFYAGFDGRCDSNLLIRTLIEIDQQWHFSVGGGITTLSDPAEEYEETLIKATGLRAAL